MQSNQARRSQRRSLLEPTFGMLARSWWPVVLWLIIIRIESTDFASATNTGNLLYRVLSFFAPNINPAWVWELDAMLRKSGHFIAYGILSVLVFFALRNTYRDRVRPVIRRTWGIYLRDYWRWEWMLLGMLATVVIASADEIHQTLIPSRTGRWQDVALDTAGALVLQVLLYLWCRRLVARERADQPELATTR